MKKTNLVVLPVLAALLLAGCTTTKKKSSKKKSSAADVSSKTSSQGGGGGGGGASSSQGGGGGASSQAGGSSAAPVVPDFPDPSTVDDGIPVGDSPFDYTSGTHTATLDFATDGETWKAEKQFPFVDATTGFFTAARAGNMPFVGINTWVNSDSTSGYYLFFANKKIGQAATQGHSFVCSNYSLGNITKVKITTTSNSSGSAKYYVAITNTKVTQKDGLTTGGAEIGKEGGEVTGSGKYFCITQTKDTYNGQIATIEVTYTI